MYIAATAGTILIVAGFVEHLRARRRLIDPVAQRLLRRFRRAPLVTMLGAAILFLAGASRVLS